MDQGKIERGVRYILQGLGCDTKDRNFMETPDRYARALIEMFSPGQIEYNTFEEKFADFILLKGHKVWTLCPHHLFPVLLTVDLAYIPNGKVLGISKLARLMMDVNREPMMQERFTKDIIAKLLEIVPGSEGAACLVKGEHDCMKIRGVKSEGSITTYHLHGIFKTKPNIEKRFFELTRR